MRWQDFRRSENVEEREDGAPSGFGVGGFKLGGGAILIVVIVSLLLGKNPLDVLTLLEGGAPPQVSVPTSPTGSPSTRPANDPQHDFVRAVLGDTEDVWGRLFQQMGRQYQAPRLVLFREYTSSACGVASAATGPFYCPADRRVYLDLAFFQELSQRFGAPGDFARSYVIAHEIGHHVQNQLGLMDEAQNGAGLSSRGQSARSVRLELQADCLAGVWGHDAAKRGALETRDIEEGLAAAAAVGDDRLQQQSRGYAVPESFTHGSSAQRVRWFRTGLQSGNIRDCDTFSARNP